jgi:hypothetical protein
MSQTLAFTDQPAVGIGVGQSLQAVDKLGPSLGDPVLLVDQCE